MYRKFILFFMFSILGASSIQAQMGVWKPDTAVVGAVTENDVFYSLPNGKIKSATNKNYMLGFGTKKFTAGVWANHGDTVIVYSTGKPFADWATVAITDTLTRLYNSDTSWDMGALNQTSSGGFDYGWGNYDQNTHNVYGDEIFIIKKFGLYTKIFIDSMNGTTNDWTVRMGYIGSPTDTVFSFIKSPIYDTSNYIYLGVGMTGFTTPQREPNNTKWDIMFTGYSTLTNGQRRNNVGLLTNYDVKSTRITGMKPDDAVPIYTNYIANLNGKINNIGYDWKTFDFASSSYWYDTMSSYLVKSKVDSLYYLIKLDYYSGGAQLGANGTIGFWKMQLNAPTPIVNLTQDIAEYLIYPNPAYNNLYIALDAKQNTDAVITMYDMTGRNVMSRKSKLNTGLNAFEIPTTSFNTGNYIIGIEGKNISIHKTIYIQH